jgi:hypothetical protein
LKYGEYAVTKEKVQINVSDVLPYAGDPVKNNDKDRACDTDRGEERCIQRFDWET